MRRARRGSERRGSRNKRSRPQDYSRSPVHRDTSTSAVVLPNRRNYRAHYYYPRVRFSRRSLLNPRRETGAGRKFRESRGGISRPPGRYRRARTTIREPLDRSRPRQLGFSDRFAPHPRRRRRGGSMGARGERRARYHHRAKSIFVSGARKSVA